MSPFAFALFDTAIGRCGLGWTGAGVARFQLPEASESATRARLIRDRPGAVETVPPPPIADAIAAVVALLDGKPADLTGIALDPAGVPPFHQRVYEVVRGIAPGETRTYGQVSALAGEPGAAQAVGRAMGRNPYPVIVPCHRVMGADGRLTGFTALGGVATKERLLQIEGALLPLFGGRLG